ncbi:MAG: NAD-dependent epimerase/dehydratase family protein [Acidobacteriia bacterium]|nr:NAD-dependent epimerase/dehydratase family protein [Terriglobia bacterium]
MAESESNGNNHCGAHVVTGAFSYTGKYIARRLLAFGKTVRTLTSHPHNSNGFAGPIDVRPLDFTKPAELVASLRGATTLYNTYWVRFDRGRVTYARAVENTRILLRAAAEAGVRRVVHISVTQPIADSPLPMPGKGDYRVQPVFVDDVADQAVRAGRLQENLVTDLVGPEVYTFREFVELIAQTIGSSARLISVSPRLAHLLTKPGGWCVRDVLLTREEIEGLMSNLLISSTPPNCLTRCSEWLRRNADLLGTRYASELARHFR